jgi:nucleoside-diphosphate-sugar epimerase
MEIARDGLGFMYFRTCSINRPTKEGKMTTLITGGTSSIGRVLIKQMAAQGEEVCVLVRPNSNRQGLELPGVRFAPGDVTDRQSLENAMQGCQKVSHLAAVVGQNVPEETWWQVNRDGTHNVLETALQQGIESYVQVSTISVLGPTEPGEIADETRPVDTGKYVNLYQKTKRAGDDLAREYSARGRKTAIVYPCFGFGASHASSHASMQEMTLLRMASGKPVAVLGSGKSYLTLAYYNDTARGIQLAHRNARAGEDYILGGEILTFPQIWAVIANILGKPPPTRRIPLGVLKAVTRLARTITGSSPLTPEFFEMIALDWAFRSDKAARELGWQMTPFAEAMAATWQEYQAQFARPVV